MFGNIVCVLLHGESGELFTVGIDDTDIPVVEVHPVLFIHEAHVVGLVGEHVRSYQRHIVLVAQHDVIEYLQCEEGEI